MTAGAPMYLVERSDADCIHLMRGGWVSMTRVAIPRSSVASVSQHLIEIRVTTNGSETYRVIPGFRRRHREAAQEAFAQWGVKV